MSMLKDCVIIGGGSSVKQADLAVLKPLLTSKFTILTNYAYQTFEGTCLTFIDHLFYKSTNLTSNPDIYAELKSLPLIIGMDSGELRMHKHSNTVLLKTTSVDYNREKSLEKGFFSGALTGIFSMSLASFLMNYEGMIYLLGFDWSHTKDTHFYNDIKHRGVGYYNYYKTHEANNSFKHFISESKLKIYNVSPNSNITCFEKIDYPTFYKLLNKEEVNQEEVRKEILRKLNVI